MATMRAMSVPARGAKLRSEERAVPEPGQGEVLIRVQACGVCHSDTATVEGRMPDSPTRASPATRSSASSMRSGQPSVAGRPGRESGSDGPLVRAATAGSVVIPICLPARTSRVRPV